MRSAVPKVLHAVAGRPMIDYVVAAARSAGLDRVVVVVGHGAEQVYVRLGDGVETVRQPTLRGTADAVICAGALLRSDRGCTDVVIAHGDCPMLTSELFEALIQCRRDSGAMIALVASPTDDPHGYGRVIRSPGGGVTAIVEEASATVAERAVREVNAGVYCVEATWLWEHLLAIQPSTSGEYYLTDLIGIAVAEGQSVQAIEAPLSVTAGVNDRTQLAFAERIIRDRVRHALMLSGVTLIDPATTYVDVGVTIGVDSIVYPGTFLEGATSIGQDCRIGPYSRIVDSRVGDGVVVELSVLEGAEVATGVRIGPFSHLRRGARIEANAELGNYAEVKNARIGVGTKLHHVSYIGDADIGAGVNVGAGTITTNYDSESGQKNRTIVEDGASLGSDTMLVAPVTIGKDAMTGAGAVVTHDVEPGMLVVGVPARPRRRRQSSST